MSTRLQQKMFLILFVGVISYISSATSWRSCVGPTCGAHRYDRAYVRHYCSDLIVYPSVNGNFQADYLFEYSDSNSFRTHEVGTTVTLTCKDAPRSKSGRVAGYTVNSDYLARENALTATCSNVNGQYTWTIKGQILHYVDCVDLPYSGPKPRDWPSEWMNPSRDWP